MCVCVCVCGGWVGGCSCLNLTLAEGFCGKYQEQKAFNEVMTLDVFFCVRSIYLIPRFFNVELIPGDLQDFKIS